MSSEKTLIWVGSSKNDLIEFPEDVMDTMGYALHLAQNGGKASYAKPLKGLVPGNSIIEIVDNFDSDTYRAVYAVKFDDAIYVLHAFQKKSKKGIKTPKPDIDLIKSRLKDAESLSRRRIENMRAKK